MRIVKFHWCRLCNREWEIQPGRTYCPRCYEPLQLRTKDLDISW